MTDKKQQTNNVEVIRSRLAMLAAEKAELEVRLAQLLEAPQEIQNFPADERFVTNPQSPVEKVALFRALFRGREDVFAKRWTNSRSGKSGYAPACANEWAPGICVKPRIKCGDCANSAFLPVTDEIIGGHLRGHHTVGVYPMLADETCWFLATDFDKASWRQDAAAFLAACKTKNVPAALERSRSGNGCHVWVFFAQPVAAKLARRLGALLVTEAMEATPEIGFDSYDRFFPSQDTMPIGGFGNLIALPLQHGPRQAGNSLFVDESFETYPDQWAYLSSIQRIMPVDVARLTEDADRQGRVLALRIPINDEDETPWLTAPSRRKPDMPIAEPLPETMDVVLGDQMYINRKGLSAGLINRIIRLAAFQNPAFYNAQAMRLSTFGIPRVIACADLLSNNIALPRGCLDQLKDLMTELGVSLRLRDERNLGRAIDAEFVGELTLEQQAAANALLSYETGVLAAGTAFGKTVVAASLIAARKTNTLVLVHRRQLMDQWIARLNTFLNVPPTAIGQIGGGKRKPTGIIDVAVIQSLVRKGDVDDVVGDYGHIVVDECHHLSAVTFELAVRRTKAKYVLGLSATVTRKDGHHPIIFMQCGPVRFRVDAKRQAAQRPFGHRVILRRTGFTLPSGMDEDRPPIQAIYAALAGDDERNDIIFNDVLKALEQKRSPLILTERKDHLLFLSEKLSRFARNVIALYGGMGAKQRNAVMERLKGVSDSGERVLIATGRYIGEGFDDARLDTLFLTMPISWRGTLAQYAGRLHRLHPAKREAIVYDYVDDTVPVLERMSAKRLRGYRSLGYSIKGVA